MGSGRVEMSSLGAYQPKEEVKVKDANEIFPRPNLGNLGSTDSNHHVLTYLSFALRRFYPTC
jgi:hypothetical protein